MTTSVMIRDKVGVGAPAREWHLTLPEGAITVRELIRQRIESEVGDYNAAPSEEYRGLVQPGDAERTLNGYRIKERRKIDPALQFEKALKAFEGNQVLVLIDDYQVGTLDEHVDLEDMAKVTFLRLTPLVGG